MGIYAGDEYVEYCVSWARERSYVVLSRESLKHVTHNDRTWVSFSGLVYGAAQAKV